MRLTISIFPLLPFLLQNLISLDRIFKAFSPFLNGRAVERSLMNHENVRLTLFLALHGAFGEYTNSKALIKRLSEDCPSLVKKFSPFEEEEELEEDEAGTFLLAQEDRSHLKSKVAKRIESSYVSRVLKLPTSCKDMPPNNFFMSLLNSLRNDYNLPTTVGLGHKGLQWFKQLSFTDPISQHRRTLNPGDFARLGACDDGEIVRYDLALIHEGWGDRRIFAVITEVEVGEERDKITGLRLLRLKKTQRFVGLSLLGPKPIYAVPLSEKLRNSPLSTEKMIGFGLNGGLTGGGELLLVDWDISFM